MPNSQPLPSQGSETRASNVLLPATQWHWIDQKRTDIMAGGWGTVKKNSIIRALLTIAMESDPDLSGCTDEDDLTNRFRQSIQQHGQTTQATEFAQRSRLLQTAVSAIMMADMSDTAAIDEMVERLVQMLRPPGE